MNKNSRVYIWKEILTWTNKPFCISDLYSRLEKKGVTNRGLMLRVLDELYEVGLLIYDRVQNKKTEEGEELFAFHVINS